MSKCVCLRCLLSFVTLLTLLVSPASPAQGQSVTSQDITSPGAVLSLGATTGASPGSVDLNWIAPGDDGNTGTATAYVVRYNTAPITETNWISSTDVAGEPLPSSAGSVESMSVTGLPGGPRYYFAIKAGDETGNMSSVSNIASAAAQFGPNALFLPIVANGSAETPPVIPETTEIIPPSTTQHLKSMSDVGTFTFSQWTPELAELDPGDVMVGGVSAAAPDGFLRKVKSISPRGDVVVVETDPATLEDAIQTASFHGSQRLTPAQVSSAWYAEGVSMAASPDGLQMEYSLKDVVLYDYDKNPKTKYDQVTATGKLTLDLGVDFGVRIEWFEVKKFWFTFSASESADIAVNWNLVSPKLTLSYKLADKYFTPVTVMAGPVPVVLTPHVGLFIKADGQIEAKLTAGVTQKAALKVGAVYEHRQWSPITEFSNTFQFNPPTVKAKASVKAYAEVISALKFYGVAGPYLGKYPYLQVEVSTGWPINPQAAIYAGFELEPGAKVDVLGKKLTDYAPMKFDFRVLLLKWQPWANTPPDAPSNPLPIDDAEDEPRNAFLLWTGGDTDGDSVTYDVYLAPNDPYPDAQVATNQAVTSYDAGMLAPNTYYYWRIVAKDARGATSPGPVWSFRTGNTLNHPPTEPSAPSPADKSTGQPFFLELSWVGGDPDGDAVTYDVFMGWSADTMAKVCDDVPSPSCPGEGEGEMFWQVVSRDKHGRTQEGPVWSYSQGGATSNYPPNVPATPGPIDNTTNQDLWTVLRWTGGDPDGDAVTYDVYFDEANDDAPDVLQLLCDDTLQTSCVPGLLAGNTPYYWQVVVRDEYGLTTRGPVWLFTTDDMVYVPGANFQMGCDQRNPQEQCSSADELPLHTVNLGPYAIDRTEVTNAEYARCVEAEVCLPPVRFDSSTRESYFTDPTYANYPVIWVSWQQAAAYCAWVDKRLPTEAEWEKAARGASDTRGYPWGDRAPTCALANFYPSGTACVGDTSAVGSYPAGASPYGALDMAGNVAEWVIDWYDDGYYGGSPITNPPGPAAGTFRVLRGGSWFHSARDLRAAARYADYPNNHDQSVGFRCARP